MCHNFKFNPLYIAVIGALFTLIGDFIALILAITAFQQQNAEKQKEQEDLQKQIVMLKEQLSKFC